LKITVLNDASAKAGDNAAKSADLVMSITGRDAKFVSGLKKGAGITGLMNPTDNPKYAAACAKAGVTAFALEYIPRISRAQSMDILSSQSNLSGYRAVVEGASIYGRAMPMMMTAAGTVAPAKCFIMGVGVAEAETAGGYAKQMSAEYQPLQAELTATHIAKQDIVITTALIPGRDAPSSTGRAVWPLTPQICSRVTSKISSRS